MPQPSPAPDSPQWHLRAYAVRVDPFGLIVGAVIVLGLAYLLGRPFPTKSARRQGAEGSGGGFSGIFWTGSGTDGGGGGGGGGM